MVKLLWDEDTRNGSELHVILMGSSPLLVHKGLSESLAGRFEMLRVPHWSFGEMRDAFGWNLEQHILHGGYPGTAPLIEDPERLANYIRDAIVEPTVSRDILSLTDVRRPALLRRLFELACSHCAEILSYNKMLGQMQDANNVTTWCITWASSETPAWSEASRSTAARCAAGAPAPSSNQWTPAW